MALIIGMVASRSLLKVGALEADGPCGGVEPMVDAVESDEAVTVGERSFSRKHAGTG